MSLAPPLSHPSAIGATHPDALAETLTVVDAVLASIGHRLPVQASRDDLASAGKLALVEALLRFDGPAEEARAYCFVRVRGAIFDELRRWDPLSRHTRAQVSFVRRATEALSHQLGREATAGEVSQATGFSVADLAQLDQLATAAQVCSLEGGARSPSALAPAAFSSIEDSISDPQAASPASSAESDDTNAGVRAALSRLAPNHAWVLRRYYLDEATLEDISAELSVSKERVRQIRETAEKKLREDFIILALWQSLLNRR